MIDFDFEYHRPDDLNEAVTLYRQLSDADRHPVYYGGGTEIVTRARMGTLRPGALIDLKGIPDLRQMDTDDGRLTFGAALTLAEIAEGGGWGLLRAACDRVADHTVRCQITLGGNIAGTIPYREAALPFWLADARAEIVGPEGRREAAFADIFTDGRLSLAPGEFLSRLSVDADMAGRPHVCTKRTRIDWIDYPLCTLVALHDGDGVRVAAAGICQGPFRHEPFEQALNERGRAREERVRRALSALPGEVVADIHGPAEYRRFVLARALTEALEELEG